MRCVTGRFTPNLTLTLNLTLLTPKPHIPWVLGAHILWALGTHILWVLGTHILWVLGWAQAQGGALGA